MTKLTRFKVLKVSFKETDTIEQIASQLSDIGTEQVLALVSTVEANPALLQDPEIKSIYDNFMATQGTQQNQFVDQPFVPQAQQQPITQPNQFQQNQSPQITEEDFIKGGGTNLFGTTQEVTPNFEKASLENLPVAVKAVFGMDTTKPGWEKEFLETAFQTKQKASKAKEIEDKLNGLETELSMLPSPLFAAMQTALKAGDWRKVLETIDVDFTKNFDDLSLNEQIRITGRLVPDVSISDSDRDNPIFKQVLQLGKAKYQTQQESIRREAQLQLDRVNQAQQKHQVAVEKEISFLKESLPDEFPTDDSLSDVKDALLNKKVLSLFYENDGTLKKGAAKAYAFAKYGEAVYKIAKEAKQRQVANMETANLINSPQTRGGGGNPNNVTQTKDEQVEQGISMFNSYKQTY